MHSVEVESLYPAGMRLPAMMIVELASGGEGRGTHVYEQRDLFAGVGRPLVRVMALVTLTEDDMVRLGKDAAP